MQTHATESRDRPTTLSRLVDAGPAWLLALTPFVFLPTGGEFENAPKLLVLQLGTAVLVAARLAERHRAEAWRRFPRPLDLGLMAMLACAALSLLQAQTPMRGLLPLLQWTGALGLYAVASTPSNGRYALERLMQALAASGAAVALIGLGQHALDWSFVAQAQAPAATFANRNHAAHFVAATLPMALGAWRLRAGPGRWLGSASLALGTAFLLIARSRAAWVGVLAALVFGLWLARGGSLRARRLRRVLAVLVVLATLGGLAALQSPRMEPRLPSSLTGYVKSGSGTVELRTIYWRNAAAMAREHPAGVGLGGFAVEYPRFSHAAADDWSFDESHRVRRVHSDPLQWLVETGVPGALAALVSLVAFGRLARRRLRDPLTAETLYPVLAAVSLLAMATVSYPMQRALPPFLLLTLFGAVMGSGNRRVPSRKMSAAVTGVLSIAVGAFAVVTLFVVPREIGTEANQAQGRLAQASGDLDAARRAFESAAHTSLGSADPTLSLAGLLAASGDPEGAVQQLERALQLDPHGLNAWLNLGHLSIELERYDEAEQALARALELDPDSLSALGSRGRLSARRGELPAAVEDYERVLTVAATVRVYGPRERVERHVLLAHLQLGGLYAELDRIEEAIRHYEEALRRQPRIPEVARRVQELRRRADDTGPPAR